jgi:hypothetical protein
MRKALLIFLCVVILIGVGAVFLNRQMRHIYGPGYDPSNSRDLQKLLVIANAGRPLREALARFKIDHGYYPMEAADFIPSYLQPTNVPDILNTNDYNEKDWAGWEYHRESTNHYQLFFQLDWDGGLWYEPSAEGTNQWSWSTSDRVVDLTQKFRIR